MADREKSKKIIENFLMMEIGNAHEIDSKDNITRREGKQMTSGDSYKIPKEDHERVFQRLLNKMLEQSDPNGQPRIVILGGQPGSGKSKLTDIAGKTVFENHSVAVINGDDYRTFHPRAEEIFKNHDRQFAELTDPDVRVWTPRLLGAAIQGRRNIIFEATMRNREPLMSSIDHFKEAGYTIDVMVMAVNEKISSISTVVKSAHCVATAEV